MLSHHPGTELVPWLRHRDARVSIQSPELATEQTNAPQVVMEAALAHTVKNKAEAACVRTDLFEKRRAL